MAKFLEKMNQSHKLFRLPLEVVRDLTGGLYHHVIGAAHPRALLQASANANRGCSSESPKWLTPSLASGRRQQHLPRHGKVGVVSTGRREASFRCLMKRSQPKVAVLRSLLPPAYRNNSLINNKHVLMQLKALGAFDRPQNNAFSTLTRIKFQRATPPVRNSTTSSKGKLIMNKCASKDILFIKSGSAPGQMSMSSKSKRRKSRSRSRGKKGKEVSIEDCCNYCDKRIRKALDQLAAIVKCKARELAEGSEGHGHGHGHKHHAKRKGRSRSRSRSRSHKRKSKKKKKSKCRSKSRSHSKKRSKSRRRSKSKRRSKSRSKSRRRSKSRSKSKHSRKSTKSAPCVTTFGAAKKTQQARCKSDSALTRKYSSDSCKSKKSKGKGAKKGVCKKRYTKHLCKKRSGKKGKKGGKCKKKKSSSKSMKSKKSSKGSCKKKSSKSLKKRKSSKSLCSKKSSKSMRKKKSSKSACSKKSSKSMKKRKSSKSVCKKKKSSKSVCSKKKSSKSLRKKKSSKGSCKKKSSKSLKKKKSKGVCKKRYTKNLCKKKSSKSMKKKKSSCKSLKKKKSSKGSCKKKSSKSLKKKKSSCKSLKKKKSSKGVCKKKSSKSLKKKKSSCKSLKKKKSSCKSLKKKKSSKGVCKKKSSKSLKKKKSSCKSLKKKKSSKGVCKKKSSRSIKKKKSSCKGLKHKRSKSTSSVCKRKSNQSIKKKKSKNVCKKKKSKHHGGKKHKKCKKHKKKKPCKKSKAAKKKGSLRAICKAMAAKAKAKADRKKKAIATKKAMENSTDKCSKSKQSISQNDYCVLKKKESFNPPKLPCNAKIKKCVSSSKLRAVCNRQHKKDRKPKKRKDIMAFCKKMTKGTRSKKGKAKPKKKKSESDGLTCFTPKMPEKCPKKKPKRKRSKKIKKCDSTKKNKKHMHAAGGLPLQEVECPGQGDKSGIAFMSTDPRRTKSEKVSSINNEQAMKEDLQNFLVMNHKSMSEIEQKVPRVPSFAKNLQTEKRGSNESLSRVSKEQTKQAASRVLQTYEEDFEVPMVNQYFREEHAVNQAKEAKELQEAKGDKDFEDYVEKAENINLDSKAIQAKDKQDRVFRMSPIKDMESEMPPQEKNEEVFDPAWTRSKDARFSGEEVTDVIRKWSQANARVQEEQQSQQEFLDQQQYQLDVQREQQYQRDLQREQEYENSLQQDKLLQHLQQELQQEQQQLLIQHLQNQQMIQQRKLAQEEEAKKQEMMEEKLQSQELMAKYEDPDPDYPRAQKIVDAADTQTDYSYKMKETKSEPSLTSSNEILISSNGQCHKTMLNVPPDAEKIVLEIDLKNLQEGPTVTKITATPNYKVEVEQKQSPDWKTEEMRKLAMDSKVAVTQPPRAVSEVKLYTLQSPNSKNMMTADRHKEFLKYVRGIRGQKPNTLVFQAKKLQKKKAAKEDAYSQDTARPMIEVKPSHRYYHTGRPLSGGTYSFLTSPLIPALADKREMSKDHANLTFSDLHPPKLSSEGDCENPIFNVNKERAKEKPVAGACKYHVPQDSPTFASCTQSHTLDDYLHPKKNDTFFGRLCRIPIPIDECSMKLAWEPPPKQSDRMVLKRKFMVNLAKELKRQNMVRELYEKKMREEKACGGFLVKDVDYCTVNFEELVQCNRCKQENSKLQKQCFKDLTSKWNRMNKLKKRRQRKRLQHPPTYTTLPRKCATFMDDSVSVTLTPPGVEITPNYGNPVENNGKRNKIVLGWKSRVKCTQELVAAQKNPKLKVYRDETTRHLCSKYTKKLQKYKIKMSGHPGPSNYDPKNVCTCQDNSKKDKQDKNKPGENKQLMASSFIPLIMGDYITDKLPSLSKSRVVFDEDNELNASFFATCGCDLTGSCEPHEPRDVVGIYNNREMTGEDFVSKTAEMMMIPFNVIIQYILPKVAINLAPLVLPQEEYTLHANSDSKSTGVTPSTDGSKSKKTLQKEQGPGTSRGQSQSQSQTQNPIQSEKPSVPSSSRSSKPSRESIVNAVAGYLARLFPSSKSDSSPKEDTRSKPPSRTTTTATTTATKVETLTRDLKGGESRTHNQVISGKESTEGDQVARRLRHVLEYRQRQHDVMRVQETKEAEVAMRHARKQLKESEHLLDEVNKNMQALKDKIDSIIDMHNVKARNLKTSLQIYYDDMLRVSEMLESHITRQSGRLNKISADLRKTRNTGMAALEKMYKTSFELEHLRKTGSSRSRKHSKESHDRLEEKEKKKHQWTETIQKMKDTLAHIEKENNVMKLKDHVQKVKTMVARKVTDPTIEDALAHLESKSIKYAKRAVAKTIRAKARELKDQLSKLKELAAKTGQGNADSTREKQLNELKAAAEEKKKELKKLIRDMKDEGKSKE